MHSGSGKTTVESKRNDARDRHAIADRLAHGVRAKPPAILQFDFRHFSLLHAIDYVANIKKEVEGLKPKTIKEYESTKTTVSDFLLHENIAQDFFYF